MGDQDVIEAKIDGLIETNNARFAGIDRQMEFFRDQVSHLAASVDRFVDVAREMLALQTRVNLVEGTSSDNKLEIAGLSSRMTEVEKRDSVREWVTKAAIAVLSGGSALILAKIVDAAHLFE